MAALDPYLFFDGKCEEAFEFYRTVFGGEFQMKSRYKEMPDVPCPDADKEKIMHIALPIKNGSFLMGSDSPSNIPLSFGNNFSVSVTTQSEDEANKLFKNLSSGGSINMPLQKTFWNAYFGMCTDKFGVNWMISYNYAN
jgi:PhnB protein